MFYNLHQHREATCRRQKEAWKETILERLEEEKQNEKGTPSNQNQKIPIVIWGLEASPSFFDFNNEASEPLKNRIRTLDLLHENYLYNDLEKDGNNYGVRIIKNWINDDYKKGSPIKTSGFSYESLITQLSGTDCPERNFTAFESSKPSKPGYFLRNPIHLVYDIFPEWHGLPVSQKARDWCHEESYMCSKVGDFKQHVRDIEGVFNNEVEPGGIHFVWLGTKQRNERCPKQQACHQFFYCLKKEFETIQLYYNPKGFVTNSKLEAWSIDCPVDFVAIGVPADWSKHIVCAGYHTVEALRKQNPDNLLKELNSFKHENNLNIPDLEPIQVESWFDD